MRGEKSGKASLCCSVFHLSKGTIYNTKAESDLRCGDKLIGEVRVELGLTSVWAGDDSKAHKLLLLPKRVGENILSNIRHDLDQSKESRDTMGRQAAGRKESGTIVFHPHRIGYISSVSSEIQRQTKNLAILCVTRTE